MRYFKCIAPHKTPRSMRSKHTDMRLHFVRDIVEQCVVKLVKVHTSENASDMVTKSMLVDKFHFYVLGFDSRLQVGAI